MKPKKKERFTDHDIRAKVGSDAGSLERAKELLAHADAKTTQRSYRRKPVTIAPTN
jgi:integrase